MFGVSDVFLNGNRTGTAAATIRTASASQETNLGNLTADANLAIAQEIDPSVVVSIKNGGGIRASIGRIDGAGRRHRAGAAAQRGARDGDGNVIKPEGGISQNDIATALAFNNGLTLLTLTKAELVAVLEHGVGQVGGGSVRRRCRACDFSFDPDLPAGDRIQNRRHLRRGRKSDRGAGA